MASKLGACLGLQSLGFGWRGQFTLERTGDEKREDDAANVPSLV